MKPKFSIQTNDQKQFIERIHNRYEADPNTIASIDVSGTAIFKPAIVALVLNESFKGCGLITPATDLLQIGVKCTVQIGAAKPVSAEVKWRTEIDAQAIKVGLMYLD